MTRDLLRTGDTRSARPALVKRRNDIFCLLAGDSLFQEESDAQIWIRKGDASLAMSIRDNQKIRANFQALTTNTQDPALASRETMDTLEASPSYQDTMDSYNRAIRIDPFVSVKISSHILTSTQDLLNTEQGILSDIGGKNTTSG